MPPLVELAVLGLGAVAGLVIAYVLGRAAPRAAFVVWLLVLFFVPVWVGVTAGFFWSAITVGTLLLIVINWRKTPLTAADAFVVVFVVLVVALFVLRGATLSALVTAILEWVVPYLWGRIVLGRVDGSTITAAIAAVATFAAVFAIIEFLTSTNVFVAIPGPGSLYEVWSPIQTRGGLVRVEGAFGHSIALGGALGMSAAFVLAARWPGWVTFLSLAAIAAAVVMTFSRIGLVTFVLAVALSVFVLPRINLWLKAVIIVVGIVAASIFVPLISEVFLSAGDEAAGSADYRTTLLSLLPRIPLLGSAGDWDALMSSSSFAGVLVNSVDNAFLVIGLRFGWIPTLCLLIVCVLAAAEVLRRGTANPASIAVAAQLPGLFAVALITQFGMFFWFLTGLAVSWAHAERRKREQSDQLVAGGSLLPV